MRKYKLKCGGRKKALFGAEAAAILAAAGINVAGTLSAAAINSSATKDAAKQQAAAVKSAAKTQAESIKTQNENSKQLQEESFEFTREQNEENRDLQKDIQMNLQMLTGQQSVNDRLEKAKIQVRNGGSMRRKLCANGSANTLLRGSYDGNIPFTVTDGGAVIPVGITPEGYAMYELKGNDHDHYHKTSSGKSKTGVGIKFADGNVIEGEGNQNSNQGEYMLTMPNDAVFISKHSIKGFNPAKAINLGMHPLQAFAIQEGIKDAYNISDSGNRSPVEKIRLGRALGGGVVNPSEAVFSTAGTPDFDTDTVAPTSVGVAYGSINGMYNNNSDTSGDNVISDNANAQARYGAKLHRKLACGGRHKALSGAWANGIGAGITTLGNLGGAWITQGANNAAAGILSNANNQAAGLIANAYDQMTGIDLSNIRKEDYAAAHAMATVRAPIVNTEPERAAAERSLQRRLTAIKKNSLSGAAAQNRMSTAETDYIDTISKIEGQAEQQREAIKQQNAKTITEVANENANRDTQANQQWANAYLQALQYNNNISNEKLAGKANAYANALTGNAAAAAQAQQANASGWASALANSGQAVGNAMTTIAKTQADKQAALAGANNESQVNYAITSGDKTYAKQLYESYKDSSNKTQQDYAARLNAVYNFDGKAKQSISSSSSLVPQSVLKAKLASTQSPQLATMPTELQLVGNSNYDWSKYFPYSNY